jgi:hypothetical protein
MRHSPAALCDVDERARVQAHAPGPVNPPTYTAQPPPTTEWQAPAHRMPRNHAGMRDPIGYGAQPARFTLTPKK